MLRALITKCGRPRNFHLLFLRWLHSLEGFKKHVEILVLVFLVSHFDTSRRCLDELVEGVYMRVVAAPRNERLQRINVRSVLHYSRPVCIATHRQHLVVVRSCFLACFASAVHWSQKVAVRCDQTCHDRLAALSGSTGHGHGMAVIPLLVVGFFRLYVTVCLGY